MAVLTPTTYVIGRVLRNCGLRQRGLDKDFSVKKIYKGSEAQYTYIVFYTQRGEQLAWQYRQLIEEATRELGWPFTVREVPVEGTSRSWVHVSNKE